MNLRLSNGKFLAHGRHIWTAFLALVVLVVLVGAGRAVFQQSCRLEASLAEECPLLADDLMPLGVAFGFWAVGLIAWLAGPRNPITILFLWTSGTLAAGKLGALGSDTGGRLFYLWMPWLAPIGFGFHLSLLERPLRGVGKYILGASYLIATLSAAPFLFWGLEALTQMGWFSFLRPAVRLSLLVATALSVGLLFVDYRSSSSLVARRRVRLILFGTILANAPIILLSVLPDTLGAPLFVPYEYTFPWLLLIPLAYVYSVFRHKLATAELALNRLAVYYLLVTLLLSIYLLAALGLNRLSFEPDNRWPLTNALFSIGLLILFVPIQRGLLRFTNWVWYGGEISYVEVVGKLAHSLSLTLDRETLRHLLMDEMSAALRLSKSALFLRDQDGTIRLLDTFGFDQNQLTHWHFASYSILITYLETAVAPLTPVQIQKALEGASLPLQEEQILKQVDINWWVPLVSGGVLQGLLLVGDRTEEDFFTAEEQRILTTLARQSGIAAHNVRLMEQVRAGREELARAHRQLLAARELEQRRLAHELHDETVQHLLGISYQLLENQRSAGDGKRGNATPAESHPSLTEIHREILAVVAQLRGVIGALRPAGLEELGLDAAMEGHVARLKREGGSEFPEILLRLERAGPEIPMAVSTTLFRVAQEAIRNAIKHSEAKCIEIRLTCDDRQVALRILDNGHGFLVPSRLSEFTKNEHYGLVGIAERVSWVGGKLSIWSHPGGGTQIEVSIPLNEVRDDEAEESNLVGAYHSSVTR